MNTFVEIDKIILTNVNINKTRMLKLTNINRKNTQANEH